MTPSELEQFLKAQAKMSARIAKKAERAKGIAMAYSAQGDRASNFARKVIQSLVRPGVAPGQRPKSKAGAETFHFDVTAINRTSDFTRAQTGSRKGAGAAHESYIEREGAAERLGDQFARTKAEMLDDTWAALGGQSYIERPQAAEEVEGYRLASFGNIAETFDERLAFWEAMEKAASRPQTHGIITQRGNDPEFWAKVDADPDAPLILKNAPPFVPLPHQDPLSERNIPNHVPPPRLSDEPSLDVLEYFRKHRSQPKPVRKGAAKPVAVDFDPGRGGRIQTRLIVELPHELSPAQRLKLAQDYCHKKFVEGRKEPLPHWCVIHAPDHHNDPRNVHMHIVFAERPSKRMPHPETGEPCWDFEVQIKVRDENKHNRLCRPFEQKTERDVHSVHWIKQARQDFATLANQALAAAGKPKIYDPRTYAAMGIGEKARERINGKDYVREKRGESTAAGDAVIAAQWEREEARLAKKHASFGPPKRFLDTFDAEIARWTLSPNSVAMHLRVHKHEYSVAIAMGRTMRAEQAANAFVLAKIQSKVLPPLQAKDEDALEAQDFIRLFRLDIVDRHSDAIERYRKDAEWHLTALARAQKANPKTTTDSGFLTSRAPFKAPVLDEVSIARHRAGRSLENVFDDWRRAKNTENGENREMSKAVLEQIAARQGEVVFSNDQTVNLKTEAAIAAVELRRRGPEPKRSLESQATADAVQKDAQDILRAHKAHTPNEPLASPVQGQETGAPNGVDLRIPISATDRYAENIRSVTSDLTALMPDVIAAARVELPKEKVRYGDEVAIAFMSETGEPIQRRVYSPMRIRTADEQAAAVAAAIEKRRAERAAKNQAELDALRVENPEDFLRKADADHARRRERPQQTATSATAGAGDTAPTKAPTSPQAATANPNRPQAGAPPLGAPQATSEPDPVRKPSTGAAFSATPSSKPTDEQTKSPSTTTSRPMQSQPPSQAHSEPKHPKEATQAKTTPSNTPQAPDAQPTAAPPSKKRVMTEQELRRRALLAARSRGRER